MIHDSTHEVPRVVKFIKRKAEWWFSGASWRESGELLFNGDRGVDSFTIHSVNICWALVSEDTGQGTLLLSLGERHEDRQLWQR